jgi:ATP-dependent helicase HrpA
MKVIVKKVHQENRDQSQNQKTWEKAALFFERTGLSHWDFADIKQKIEVIKAESGFSVYGFPCLVEQENGVALKLYSSIENQESYHGLGVKKLLLLSLEKELAWLDREMKFEKSVEILCVPFAKPEVFKQNLVLIIMDHLFNNLDFKIWKKTEFEALQKTIKKEITHTGSLCVSILHQVLRQYTEFQSIIKRKLSACNTVQYKNIAEILRKELANYIAKILDNRLNYIMLMQYERYFSAFKYKIDRGFADANKFAVKYESIRHYIENSEKLLLKLSLVDVKYQNGIIEFAMILEEYKISLFAQQEVKTLFPVSIKRLEEKWEVVRKII